MVQSDHEESSMLKRAALLLLTGLLTSSCASTISAYKNRAVSKHGIMYKDKFEEGQVFVMTGERRLAVAIPLGTQRHFNLCAEPLPDVAAAFGAASSLNASRAGTEVGVTDATAMKILQTFNRTENAELLRVWSFVSCLAWAQGQLENPVYKAAFKQMTAGIIDVMKTNAIQARAPAATGAVADATVQPDKANDGNAAGGSSESTKET